MIPVATRRPPYFVLGTAQLGLVYGAANCLGMPDFKTAIALVRHAIDAGVRVFDTARAYGEAERRIGAALPGDAGIEVVTKLDPLSNVPPDAAHNDAVAAARTSVDASRRALRQEVLQTLLLHRASHRTAWDGAVWDHLREEQARGTIQRLGVSAQTPAEVAESLDDPLVRHVQLPFNLLDWRWSEAGIIDLLRNRSDVTVHVRSVFLQGLLASETARWPIIGSVDPNQIVDSLDRLVRQERRTGRADLCLAYARAQDWIDGVVIGCETACQLQENLALFCRDTLSLKNLEPVLRTRPRVPAELLDPIRWPATA